jgi:hypothetical protein
MIGLYYWTTPNGHKIYHLFGRSWSYDGILSKDELTAGSYGHEKYPAIQPSTPGTEVPTLESAKTGDVTNSSDPWYDFTSTDWGYLNPQ